MRSTPARHKLQLILPLAILMLTAQMCGDTPPPPPDPDPDCDGGDVVCHSLAVSRHTSTSLTDARADEILADATAVARINDGAGDVACDVLVRRDGAVTTFSQGSGIVNSSAEFSEIIALPGHVKIVNQINWCGTFSPNIIGCAPLGGNSLAVVRFTANQEGILWLHELGHNQGLNHRNTPTRAVMFPSIGADHNFLDATECDVMRQPIGPDSLVTDADEAEVAAATIEAFVRRIYIHGLPYEVAIRFDDSVVPTLLQMLSSEEDRAYWPNIVTMLSIVGDEEVMDRLQAFIDAGEGALSPERYRAASSAVIALGYLAHRAGSDRAIDYLREGLQPESWNDQVAWTSPFHPTTEARNVDLAQLSIVGLALSGRESGIAALRSLQSGELGTTALAAAGGIVNEALTACETIDSQGMESYYREGRN